jgi:hypothetical protein
MHANLRPALLRVATVISVVAFGVWIPLLGGSTSVHAAPAVTLPLPVIEYHPTPSLQHRNAAARAVGNSSPATTIPLWNSNFTDGSSAHVFGDTLVGADPSNPAANRTTKVPVLVIPIAFQIAGGGLYDPTVPSNCTTDRRNIPTRKTLGSPIFKNADYTVGGTDLGKGQYLDEFRRAEFWSDTGGGAAPRYHTKLAPKLAKKVTVDVPAGLGREVALDGSCTIGIVNVGWLETYLENTAIPALQAAKVLAPTQFALFVASNVVSEDTQCCVLGFHYFTPSPLQTYGISDYDSTPPSTWGGTVADTSVMSHEVGEWMDDPFATNGTDPWGHIGQQPDCQTNLEVGDPLSGTTLLPVAIGQNAYHVQELAFAGWFYHWSPSLGVNGWYSFNDTFTSPAAPCF